MTDVERALIGLQEIAAFLETLWRERLQRRGVCVAPRNVRRWLRHRPDPLPAHRLDVPGAPWVAAPSEVSAWWSRRLLSSTGMVDPVQSVLSGR